ncbi:S41 family peptidase [Photobacterium leiognathi]|uniref:S41 family peptidase n=1 Tax=Photobacterium leiognathi TaxID=553611 RepID=UPI0027356024|nr:S41 family peptidase [Photobacterium leiognathi]
MKRFRLLIAITMLLSLFLITGCSGEDNEKPYSPEHDITVTFEHPTNIEEKDLLTVTIKSNVSINSWQWYFSIPNIEIIDSSTSSQITIRAPNVGLSGEELTITAEGQYNNQHIKSQSVLFITPVTENFTLQGIITDSPISNADITLHILGSERTLTSKANTDGHYLMDVILDDDESPVIYLEAVGHNTQNKARLIKMIGDIKQIKEENKEIPSFNVTNLTTAEYALAKYNNNNENFDSYITYNKSVDRINDTELIQLATIIKLIIDKPDDPIHLDIDDEIIDTLELVTNKEKRDNYLYNTINTKQFTETKDEILKDEKLIKNKLSLKVGEYKLITNTPQSLTLSISENVGTITNADSTIKDSFSLTERSKEIIFTSTEPDGFSLSNISEIISRGDISDNILSCNTITLHSILRKSNYEFVNISIQCIDTSNNTNIWNNQVRLYKVNDFVKSNTYDIIEKEKENKTFLISDPLCLFERVNCKTHARLNFVTNIKNTQPFTWVRKNNHIIIDDNINFHILDYNEDFIDIRVEKENRVYFLNGKLITKNTNHSTDNIIGKFMIHKTNSESYGFIDIKNDGKAELWSFDSSNSTQATHYDLSWTMNHDIIEFSTLAYEQFNANFKTVFFVEHCDIENTCAHFNKRRWHILGSANNKIHLTQNIIIPEESQINETLTLLKIDQALEIEYVNSFKNWNKGQKLSPWRAFIEAVNTKNSSSLSDALQRINGLKNWSLDIDYAEPIFNTMAIDNLSQLQQIIDNKNTQVFAHQQAVNTLITSKNPILLRQALEDLIFSNIDTSLFDTYINEIMNTDEIDTENALTLLIENINQEKYSFVQLWNTLTESITNKDDVTTLPTLLAKFEGLTFNKDYVSAYIDAFMLLETVENVEELQDTIDKIDEQKALQTTAWNTIQAAINENDFSAISSSIFNDLLDLQFIPEHMSDYVDHLLTRSHLDNITQLQTIIDNVDDRLYRHHTAWGQLVDAVNSGNFSLISLDTFYALNNISFQPEYLENYKSALQQRSVIEDLSTLQVIINLVDQAQSQLEPDTWTEGVYLSSEDFINRCALPRTGIDPYTNEPYPDKEGSTLIEKLFLRSFHHEEYLWYDEIDDVAPEQFSSVSSYFNQLKTQTVLPSNRAKDRFHFSQSYDAYMSSFSQGISYGFGFNWVYRSTTAPRDLRIAYVDEGSVANIAGIARGDKLLSINNVDVVNTNNYFDLTFINQVLSDPISSTYSFSFSSLDGSVKDVLLTPEDNTITPAMYINTFSSDHGQVGYFMLNEFHRQAQDRLIEYFTYFAAHDVKELIIDLRYNQGGLLYLSAQLGYMIAYQQSINRIFESLTYNDKQSQKNTDLLFINRYIDWTNQVITNTLLPTLNLNRVFILTTNNTASASESLINALRGIDVEVILIGDNTYGKPYGFIPEPNCDMVYYIVQFVGQNEKGFGDYPYGFEPVDTEVTEIGLNQYVRGCRINDDIEKPLGSIADPMITHAMNIIAHGKCLVMNEASNSNNTAPSLFYSSNPKGIHQKIYKQLYSPPPWL